MLPSINWPWYFGDPADYPARLNGKTIDHAESSAGMVEIFADDTRILLNDGTNIRFFPGRCEITG